MPRRNTGRTDEDRTMRFLGGSRGFVKGMGNGRVRSCNTWTDWQGSGAFICVLVVCFAPSFRQ